MEFCLRARSAPPPRLFHEAGGASPRALATSGSVLGPGAVARGTRDRAQGQQGALPGCVCLRPLSPACPHSFRPFLPPLSFPPPPPFFACCCFVGGVGWGRDDLTGRLGAPGRFAPPSPPSCFSLPSPPSPLFKTSPPPHTHTPTPPVTVDAPRRTKSNMRERPKENESAIIQGGGGGWSARGVHFCLRGAPSPPPVFFLISRSL